MKSCLGAGSARSGEGGAEDANERTLGWVSERPEVTTRAWPAEVVPVV
jgi:hypothetical protein